MPIARIREYKQDCLLYGQPSVVVKLLFFACQYLFSILIKFAFFFSAVLIQGFYSGKIDVVLTNISLKLFPGECYFCVYLSIVPAGQKAPVVYFCSQTQATSLSLL